MVDVIGILYDLEQIKKKVKYSDFKSIYDKTKTFNAAAEAMRGGYDQKAWEKLVGYDRDTMLKVIAALDKQTKAIKDLGRARFPPVTDVTSVPWAKWFAASGRFGEGSKEETAAREACLKALLRYDGLLEERIAYCGLLMTNHKRTAKSMADLQVLALRSEKLCKIIMAIPEIKGSHQSAAFQMLFNIRGLSSAAGKLSRGHGMVVAKAQEHRKKVQKDRQTNLVYIGQIRAANVMKMLKAKLPKFGFGL